MEFKDRKSKYPGRVKIKNLSNNIESICELTLLDEPIENGTPLNKATIEALKEDILDSCVAEPALVYTTIIEGTAIGDFYDEPTCISMQNFNRKPHLNESFIGIFYELENNSDGTFDENSFITVCKIIKIDAEDNTCWIQPEREARTTGTGISKIQAIGQDENGGNIYEILLSSGQKYNIVAPRGIAGPVDVGISDIRPNGQDENGGNIYEIVLSNGETFNIVAPKGSGFTGKINDVDASIESIYAPISAGNKGYFLQSKGEGAPSWEFPFAFSGKQSPYTASATITLPNVGVGKIATDVRSCTNADTVIQINLPAGGTYRYVYVLIDPSNTSQQTTKTSVGVSTKAAGGTTVCSIGGSTSRTIVQITYYRVS